MAGHEEIRKPTAGDAGEDDFGSLDSASCLVLCSLALQSSSPASAVAKLVESFKLFTQTPSLVTEERLAHLKSDFLHLRQLFSGWQPKWLNGARQLTSRQL